MAQRQDKRQAGPMRARGFRSAGACVATDIRRAGEKRGFGVARLLTRWEEIAGPDLAAVTRPVRISYAQQGFGGTLVLLTTGAQAPLVAMQEPALIERVNACYGYAAIRRIRLTQTSPTEFAADRAGAGHGAAKGQLPATPSPAAPGPAAAREAHRLAARATDPGLREALERLAANVLARGRRGASHPPSSDPDQPQMEPVPPT